MDNYQRNAGVCVLALLLAAIAGSFWLATGDRHRWESYAAAHHCRMATAAERKELGATEYLEPDRTVWECDNGEVQVR